MYHKLKNDYTAALVGGGFLFVEVGREKNEKKSVSKLTN